MQQINHKEEDAPTDEIKAVWRKPTITIRECLWEFKQAWRSDPLLTESRAPITEANVSTNEELPHHIRGTTSYKIMQLIGKSRAQNQWSDSCDLICYKASIELPPEEADILNELYERVEGSRIENEKVHNVMAFWKRLDEYRDWLLKGSEEDWVTPDQANEMLSKFKYNELWYELTKQQQKQKNWRSLINNILHRNAGWTHAAKSVMQYGLPKLAKPRNPDDAFERIGALVLLAKDIAHWLIFLHAACTSTRKQSHTRRTINHKCKH